MTFNLNEILTSFMVLFAVIDIIGSLPVVLEIKKKTGDLHEAKATLVSLSIMLGFLFVG